MIDEYTPQRPGVESVDADNLQLFCGDELPSIGTAVAIGDGDRRLFAVVRRHAGARRVDAWLPCRPDWVKPTTPIEPTGRPAGFAPPQQGPLTIDASLIRPAEPDDVLLWPEAPAYNELSGRRGVVKTDIAALDVLAPICAGGLNLIIDQSKRCEAFFRLASLTFDDLNPESALYAGHRGDPAQLGDNIHWHIDAGDSLNTQIASLQLAIAASPTLRTHRSATAVVELPDLHPHPPSATPAQDGRRRGIADIVARLGRHLVSTDEAELTTLLLLRPPSDNPGLATIIDSLSLGDVDATLVIDEEGRLRPERSSSDAPLDDEDQQLRQQHQQTMHLARRAADKSAVFGDVELTDDERRAIEEAEEFRVRV